MSTLSSPRIPARNPGKTVRRAGLAVARAIAGLRPRSAEVDGLRIAYDEGHRGAGETIVALHGFSAEGEVWARFAAGLRDHHLVIPDVAGHGRTPFHAGADYSAPAQARRVIGLLDALGVHRAHLIGNSMGGFIAATAARLAPERVRSLALVDAAGVHSPSPSVLDRRLEAGENPFLLDSPAQFDAFYALTMARPPFVPAFVRRSIAADYVARRGELAEMFAAFHLQDWLEDHLAEITAPTWVAWGRRDQLIDVSAAELWAAGLPRATLTVYDDLGHMPMLEAPRRTVRDYRAFLRGI